ncbi:MAG: hypothetical protein E4H11_04950 [Myxococcales bacterium]|nr:MAG: hypothetical protein E4H11_04950 [Myxococcales bacterium]
MRRFSASIVCLGLAAASVAFARESSRHASKHESWHESKHAEGTPFQALDAEIDELRAEIEELRGEATEHVAPPLMVDADRRVLGPLVPGPGTAFFFLFRSHGKSAVLLAQTPNEIASPYDLRFVAAGCQGEAYGPVYGGSFLLEVAGVFYPATGNVYSPVPEVSQERVEICSILTRSGCIPATSGSGCSPPADHVPMQEVGILEFTPPLRIE